MSPLLIKIVAVLVGLGAVFGAGFYSGNRWDQGTIQKMRADAASAVVKAQAQAQTIEQQQAQINQEAGAADAAQQLALQAKARVVTKEVTEHVTDTVTNTVGCVTWGMLRVYDAHIYRVGAADLQPPASQSDDSCSTTSPSSFMDTVVGNVEVANQNAQQLNDLEDNITKSVKAFNQGGKNVKS